MNKVLTPLDVLKQLKEFVYELELGNVDKLFVKGSFNIIETDLKALEIIKKKRVNVDNFLYHITKDTDYKEYKRLVGLYKIMVFSNQVLTQEEYDLLKEVLL